ncbi:DUF2165 domain-containing protein [Myxococcota bacterium]|nr:DUF2165 domain-containing protein [Myxococcota bacterium]
MSLRTTSWVLRTAQIAILAFLGFYAALVAWGNFSDPDTNLVFVEHVMRMDTTFGRPGLMARSIDSPSLHQFAFGLIVFAEVVIASLCLVGAALLTGRLAAEPAVFRAAKGVGLLGLLGAVCLWFFGFQVLGGEWFASWQSEGWNGLDSAERISTYALAGLIFVGMRED